MNGFNVAETLALAPVKIEASTPSIKSEERTTPTTPTSAPPCTTQASDVLRGILPQPLFAQVPFQQAAMAQAFLAAQAHAAAAHAQHGLGFPGVPVFPPGIPADFKPEMLMAGGPGPMQFMLGEPHLYHPYALDGMKKRNATREATAPLKDWLHAHRKNPYPSKADKLMLAMHTRMTLTQVSTWFANARRRLKKENKMTWSPQNRRGDGCDEDDDEDDDDMGRPSSSNSISSERKGESLLGQPHLASPTPSGGSGGSEELLTASKMTQESPIPTDDSSESPKRKPKMWSIADVTSDDDSDKKKDSTPPSSDEDHNNTGMGNILLQKAMKKQIEEMMARMDPNLFRNAMNPFMLQLFAQQAAQAQFPFLSAPPNEAGEQLKVSRSELSSGDVKPFASLFADIVSPIPPRVETPAY